MKHKAEKFNFQVQLRQIAFTGLACKHRCIYTIDGILKPIVDQAIWIKYNCWVAIKRRRGAKRVPNVCTVVSALTFTHLTSGFSISDLLIPLNYLLICFRESPVCTCNEVLLQVQNCSNFSLENDAENNITDLQLEHWSWKCAHSQPTAN